MAATAAIRAVDVSKRFGEVTAVDGMTFDLEAGRIYGLLGPNGSGKTTLIRLLTGMTRPTSGYAEVLGTRMPSRPTLERIGYMTQADGIYPALTVGENARFFAEAYGADTKAAVDDALALVELADRRNAIAGTLSGGQRRRLSLACALVHRPEVLFLDEPTVGVDPLLRVQFWGHFRALADGGTTIVVSSHVMDEADRCDDLLFVRAGKVIARGTGRQLRDGGRHGRPRGGVPAVRRRRRGRGMSARRLRALVRRVTAEIRRDRPSLGLLFIAPIIITGLLTYILREGDTPDVSVVARQPGAAARRRSSSSSALEDAGIEVSDARRRGGGPGGGRGRRRRRSRS